MTGPECRRTGEREEAQELTAVEIDMKRADSSETVFVSSLKTSFGTLTIVKQGAALELEY